MEFVEPMVSSYGLFMVRWKENYPHWLAWTEWRRDALNRTNATENLTVPFAWPPVTSDGAQIVTDGLKQIAEANKSDKTWKHGAKPVPEFPFPWQEWTAAKKRKVIDEEIRRRDALGGGGDFMDWKMAHIGRNQQPILHFV